ncbi:MAG: hypothetical protein AABY22_15370 [Nanoarchaeota archaeon]
MKNKKQIDGKLETTEPSSLSQLWGETGLEKYKTFNIDEYTTQINGLNKSDLDSHAHGLGLIPVENRQLLVKRLLDAFRQHIGQFRRPKSSTKGVKLPNKKVMDILAEGR